LTEFEQRRRAVVERLAVNKIEALLVSSPANLRYLTGYSGSNGLMLITGAEERFFTDPRYGAEATSNITCKVQICKVPLINAAAAIAKRRKLKKIGIEPSWLHVAEYNELQGALPSGVELQPIASLVEDLRSVKSPEEISKIRHSVRVNSEAFTRTLNRVRPGVRENEIAAELDFQMRILGAEKTAFDTIVAAGPRSALPHAQPTKHPLGDKELLLIDSGAMVDGYASDMTRVAYAGTPPKRIREIYKGVAEAQLAAIDAVRAGVPVYKVDATAREVLKKHGFDKEFIHSTGHGLGLEIHEPPKIGKKQKTRLQAGMVITIEPGAYIDGLAGVRIEDTVLVTERGCQVITQTPKRLFPL
jgi:Xaa-Pro aminopeptidase